MHIDNILQKGVEKKVSDIHLTAGLPPAYRISGDLRPDQEQELLQPEQTDLLARQMMSEEQWEEFQERGDFDFSYSIPDLGRFRVNAFKQRGKVALVLRLINSEVLTFQQLGLPPVLKELAMKPKGLVLVTGPTGSGKSTTLTALIDAINSERRHHIITLEDPIEFLHQHKKSIVNQREVGPDSKSFAAALKSALRQDPDVILVGEMRDLETISTAVTAAETGHLVFATLHTSSAASTVDRIIDVFPAHQQQQIRVQLAATIQGIIAQQLIPKLDGKGRVAAMEILVATPAIRNLIREGKTHQLLSQLQTGGRHGMQALDNCLRNMAMQKAITVEEALSRATDSEALARNLGVVART